jgi:hypothetical protein
MSEEKDLLASSTPQDETEVDEDRATRGLADDAHSSTDVEGDGNPRKKDPWSL